jgi:phospholipase C
MAAPGALAAPIDGIHNIQHVVVIMQENRSFDSYFGTYPGANGIPAGVCVPDPLKGGCVAPFHDPTDENYGGPHGHGAFTADLDGGKMDGFVGQAETGSKCKSTEPGCSPCTEQGASAKCIDVMGYHDAREIPNYWSYAQNFVLQDNMYEPSSSWSWPEHLFEVSAWSATCSNWNDPMSCLSAIEGPPDPRHQVKFYAEHSLPWTDITYLLHKYGVSWRYFVSEGNEPDCEDDEAMTCAPVAQGPKTPGIWNPLVDFLDVKEDGQMGNVQSLNSFYSAVKNTSECGLSNVSWIVPNSVVSEHPPALISNGQAYVTTLVNSIMRSPCWGSTAIFLSWDDWGGFYDHVAPVVSAVPVLQLTASVAGRQDMRLHDGRVYLLVGCNEACSIYAHGHLNLRRGRHHLGLRSVRTKLAADRTVRIALSLSHRNLSAVHRALREHRSVKAAIEVEATSSGGRREDYSVTVVLTWR